MKSDLIDVTLQLHHKTDKAILVSDDGNRAKAIWLPVAHIEMEPMPGKAGIVVVTLPEWLANDKGLI